MYYSLQIFITLLALSSSLSAQIKSVKELDRLIRKEKKTISIGKIKLQDGDKSLLVFFEKKDNRILAVREEKRYGFSKYEDSVIMMCQFNYINDSLLRVWLVKKHGMLHAYISNDKIIAVEKSGYSYTNLPDVMQLKEKSEQFRATGIQIVNQHK